MKVLFFLVFNRFTFGSAAVGAFEKLATVSGVSVAVESAVV